MRQPVWILNRCALAAHGRLVAEHGGAGGADLLRLCLALGWPRTILALAQERVTLFDLAAGYAEATLRLRPFASGNERMAYLLTTLFLALNGVRLPAAAGEQLAIFHAVRIKALDRGGYARWMLMRTVAEGRGTVIGVRRNAEGKVVGVGMLTSGRSAQAARRVATRADSTGRDVPLLMG